MLFGFFNTEAEIRKDILTNLKAAVKIFHREKSAAPKALSEFEQMALAVKRNIRGMIRAGSAEDAENALNEYEALCPEDIEIKILREAISGLK